MAYFSARKNAPSLRPHLLYEGTDDKYTARARELGVTVHLTHLRVGDILRAELEKGLPVKSWINSLGALQRLEIPFLFGGDHPEFVAGIESDPNLESEYVFYTDTDVIFLDDINTCILPKPRVLAIGAEHVHDTKGNTGVMTINIEKLREHYEPLVRYAVEKEWNLASFDQGVILGYFGQDDLDQLPDIFNWKGYWGNAPPGADPVRIIHLHGPKPSRGLECLHATANATGFEVAFSHDEMMKACPAAPGGYALLFSMAPDKGLFYGQIMKMISVFRSQASRAKYHTKVKFHATAKYYSTHRKSALSRLETSIKVV